jgi:hypothetical protein
LNNESCSKYHNLPPGKISIFSNTPSYFPALNLFLCLKEKSKESLTSLSISWTPPINQADPLPSGPVRCRAPPASGAPSCVGPPIGSLPNPHHRASLAPPVAACRHDSYPASRHDSHRPRSPVGYHRLPIHARLLKQSNHSRTPAARRPGWLLLRRIFTPRWDNHAQTKTAPTSSAFKATAHALLLAARLAWRAHAPLAARTGVAQPPTIISTSQDRPDPPSF